MNGIKMDKLIEEIENIRKKLYEKYETKEKFYLKIKEAQRFCGEAISLVQQNKMREANERISLAEGIIKEIMEGITNYMDDLSEVYNTMLQEYVEAKALIDLEERGEIPKMDYLKVTERAYILGLADLMGELKRKAISNLINAEIENAKEKMKIINQIFQSLEVLEYPRSLVPGLRKKLDDMRKSIEDLEKIIATSTITIKLYELLNNIYGEKYLKD
ncbi:MAG: hypothetical protein QXO74_03210 [Candidatus Methanomethylicia archaeon]